MFSFFTSVFIWQTEQGGPSNVNVRPLPPLAGHLSVSSPIPLPPTTVGFPFSFLSHTNTLTNVSHSPPLPHLHYPAHTFFFCTLTFLTQCLTFTLQLLVCLYFFHFPQICLFSFPWALLEILFCCLHQSVIKLCLVTKMMSSAVKLYLVKDNQGIGNILLTRSYQRKVMNQLKSTWVVIRATVTHCDFMNEWLCQVLNLPLPVHQSVACNVASIFFPSKQQIFTLGCFWLSLLLIRCVWPMWKREVEGWNPIPFFHHTV